MTKPEQESGTARKSSRKEEITISEEEIKNTMIQIFGADGGARYREAPWELLRITANYLTFKSLALIVKVFDVELKRGNLGVIKLLLELVEQVAKHGSIEPAVMQSFADLLIKSLQADVDAEAKVDELTTAQSGIGALVVIESAKK